MPPADTLESCSDSVQDCIHQYDPILEHVSAASKQNDDLAEQQLQTDNEC